LSRGSLRKSRSRSNSLGSIAQDQVQTKQQVLEHELIGAAVSKLTAQDLAQFTGTTCYYRICRKHLLTDGTHYLAEKVGCYWLMDAVASHVAEIGTADWFIVVRIEVEKCRAITRYEDGNGRELASQAIPYTDFPLPNLTLYAVWDTEHWVIMLPGEY